MDPTRDLDPVWIDAPERPARDRSECRCTQCQLDRALDLLLRDRATTTRRPARSRAADPGDG